MVTSRSILILIWYIKKKNRIRDRTQFAFYVIINKQIKAFNIFLSVYLPHLSLSYTVFTIISKDIKPKDDIKLIDFSQ